LVPHERDACHHSKFSADDTGSFPCAILVELSKTLVPDSSASLCVIANALANHDQHDNVPLGLAISAAIWGTITFASPYLGARAVIKYRGSDDMLQYTFSEAGIDVAAKHSGGHVDWTIVTGVTETKVYIMVFAKRILTHLIPKTSFSAEDLKDLKALIRSSVSAKFSSVTECDGNYQRSAWEDPGCAAFAAVKLDIKSGHPAAGKVTAPCSAANSPAFSSNASTVSFATRSPP
jgi:YcxB-like protein